MLVAAMNPCPCGFFGDRRRACRCSDPQIQRYASRISGPLRDRIDLVVEVPAIGSSVRDNGSSNGRETSAAIRERVVDARMRQQRRFGGASQKLNRQLDGSDLSEHCRLDSQSAHMLETAIQKFCLSARGCDRVLRVSRTIGDLAGSEAIVIDHLAEALQYRFSESSPSLRQP
jgi:magnesium chelatase family protein